MCYEVNTYCRNRQAVGMSVEEAAQWLGVTAAELRAYEMGEREPDAVVIRRMACLYGVSADELLAE